MHYTSYVDVLLLLVRDEHVLLAERANTGYADGQWNLPSGKLEKGENLVDAILREAREEIQVELRRAALRMVTSVHYLNPEGDARIGFFFRTHLGRRTVQRPMDQLPDNTVPYSLAGAELLRRGEPFGIQGWPQLVEARLA